ncbi:MAG: methylenetetrahydrofolate--tRNA-(uracil(54)-C(5))-methyltransferase (FADH(2)-oxidizing) TrmFO, partial [Clostridiales bacterium]|nr:methylenetetrahydrofolate--tRNA-(uracil(54)-C(5))-methyltransferase (FADH(2)-oxidizing) TrmFO [Clostridiales bacterium]
MMRASVIGAGLAGCEAAWQLSRQGIEVDLYEMKPHRFSPAHRENTLAELVCSNSLRSNQLTNAVGLLKEEMRRFGSLILSCADETSVDAGGALAVDRKGFSELVTKRIEENKLINLIRQEVKEIPEGDVIIATGPLSSEAISGEISKLIGREYLSFFDASAPIVTLESVDMGKAFYASRYGKGSGTDYLNCPMNKEEYDAFVEALLSAETVQLHEFERGNV